jgi:16S rRNA (uracil1498-N3)-methyltransferase
MSDRKSSPRLYVPGELAAGSTCVLPPAQAHHAARVLRLRAGEPVTLFNGDGGEYAAVIARIARDRVALDVGARAEIDREAALAVTLEQAISSGERMDFTVQKAVELGVVAIRPLTTTRSVVRLAADRAERRVAHWQTVANHACEQCGRNRVPAVAPVAALHEWLTGAARAPGILSVVLSARGTCRLRDLARPHGAITLLAGPEGGFTPEEERIAEQAGCLPVRLGPRVLRTETAALAAIAAMHALWGDF